MLAIKSFRELHSHISYSFLIVRNKLACCGTYLRTTVSANKMFRENHLSFKCFSLYRKTGVIHGCYFLIKSRDSSVGIALGYGLDDRGSRVRFSAGAGNFSLRHRFQNGSGAHPASYPMGTRGSFPGGTAAGA
jgi:hypothetical protein